MNKLQKFALVSGAVVIAGLFGFLFRQYDVVPDQVEEFLGANLPDRCEFYDQFASRSIKDLVKGSSGKVYSYRIVSQATNIRYFRLHNRATAPINSSDVVYVMPLSTTTASATPVVIEERFVVPMDFTTGIGFSISDAFGTWVSASGAAGSYAVSLCYY